MSQIIDFYHNECNGPEGYKLDDVLYFSKDKLEFMHDWIQWLFPLKEPSNFNPDAPLLTDEDILIFKSNPEISGCLTDSFLLFVDFIGLECNYPENPCCVFKDKLIFSFPNHNWFRISRVLKSLMLLGHENKAKALFECLRKLHEEEGYVSENSFSYWKEAVNAV